MSRFANAAAFSAPRSMLQAMGADLSSTRAIVDAQGHVLAYARTGGMIDPQRHELHSRDTIYRFGSSARSTKDVAVGGWWLQRQEFELLLRFANTHDIFLGLAMRLLCAAVLRPATVGKHCLSKGDHLWTGTMRR